MIYVNPGDPKTFGVTLAPPADANSVIWSLRDNNGIVMTLAPPTILPNVAGAVSAAIIVLGNLHTISAPALNESRFLMVQWTSGGVTQNCQINYVVTPFIPVRAKDIDVMRLIGINAEELALEDIDIVAATMYVRDDVGDALFTPALTSGGLQTARINQMIALWAAFEVAPSIQLRVAQMQKNELAQFSRYSKMDITQWTADITFEYDRIRGDFLGYALVPNPTFLTFGYGTRTMFPPGYFEQTWPAIPPLIDPR